MALTYTDQGIRQNVTDEIGHDVRIDSSNVNVMSTNGVVTLNGSVPSYFQKVTAGDDARRIKGVVDVQNNLMVSPPQFTTDLQIASTVRGNIERDVRIMNPENIGATVTNGIVTLTGTVPNYAQKDDASNDAWTAQGVIDVLNNIAVVPAVTRTDAEIAQDVRVSLESDPAIDATHISVNVSGGTVFLDGTVPSYYQIQQAANDAWGVLGVVNVVNNLTVSF